MSVVNYDTDRAGLLTDDGTGVIDLTDRFELEDSETYDADFYSRELVRAAESIVSPFGWDRKDVRRYLREHDDATLTAFE